MEAHGDVRLQSTKQVYDQHENTHSLPISTLADQRLGKETHIEAYSAINTPSQHCANDPPSMPSPCVLAPKLIPFPQVSIGSLIINPFYPFQDAFVLTAPIYDQDFFDSPCRTFHDLLSRTHGTELHGQLTTLASAAFKWETDASRELGATVETLYELKEPLGWFKRLCNNTTTRSWLQGSLAASYDVFLIAGFRTLTDPKLVQKRKANRAFNADGTVSGDTVITGMTGLPINTSGTLDFGAGVDLQRGYQFETSFEQQGEYVYGLHYRKVKFRWLTRDKVSTARLDSENVWLDLTRPRANDRTGVTPATMRDAVIEADLTEQVGAIGEYVFDEDEEAIFVLPEFKDH